MKKFYKLLTLLVFVFTLFVAKANASGVISSDISYKWVSGNTYEVTVNLLRDCSGTEPSNTALVNLVSTCGQSASLVCTLTNAWGTEVSQLCPAQMINSTCFGGTLPGMQQYTFKGVITLPAQCDTWTMSWAQCCRNTSDNITSSSSWGNYAEAKLKSVSFQSNSSPMFTAIPVPNVCIGQLVNYNLGVVDEDVLVYSLVAALSDGVALVYNAPYSATNPINGITINSATGQLSFTPSTAGKFVVAVKVDEYTSGGVLKGSVVKDIQFVVQACANTVPSNIASAGVIDAASFVGAGATRTGNFSIAMCEGNSFTFNSVFSDANAADILTYNSNVLTALPGSTISQVGTNPTTLTISWTAPVGFKPLSPNFYITIKDNACPIPGTQTFVYTIQVADQTTAGANKTHCQVGGTTTLDGYGGTNFTWTKVGGGTTYLSCTNCQLPTITAGLPTGTHTYTVTSDLTGCVNTASVVITSVPALTTIATAVSICKNGSTTLDAGVGAGVYTYTWTPSTYLSTTNTATTVASPKTSTVYSVLATGSLGCSQRKNSTVTVSGVGPIPVAYAVDSTLCIGQSTSLKASGFVPPASCGTGTVCSSASTLYTLGTGTSTSTTASPYYGFWNDARVQYIVTKAELNSMGIFYGVFKTLAFKLGAKNSSAPYNGFTIRMTCTSLTDFPSSGAVFQTGATTVYGPASVNPSGNSWNTYALTGNGFAWDGESNIIVEVCFDNSGYTSTDEIEYTATTANMTIHRYADSGGPGCDLLSPSSFTNRANMQFGICASTAGLSYSWSPATYLSATNISSPTVTAPAVTTTYMVTVTSGSCSSTKSVTVKVGPHFNLAMPSNTSTCLGSSTLLSATPDVVGAYTYVWSPSTTLNASNIANPLATPITTTTYVATVTSAAGCKKTGSVTLSTKPDNFNVSASASASVVCKDSPVNLTASAGSLPSVCGTGIACTSGTTKYAVGTGTSTSTTASPYYGLWHDARSQYIYTKAELNAAGMYGGVFKTLAFKMGAKNSSAPYNGFTIKMMCTSMTGFSSGSNSFQAGLTTVYGPANVTPTANSWNTYTLAGNGFTWNGTSNIIVEVCFNNSGWTSNDPVEYTTTGGYMAIYDYADNDVGCNLYDAFATNTRPNIQLGICVPTATSATYVWSPAADLSDPLIANPIATPSESTTYTVTATDGLSGCEDTKQVAIMVNRVDAGPDVNLCSSGSTTIVATFNGVSAPSSCGAATSACGSTTNYTIGNGTSSSTSTSTGSTPFAQFYTKQQVQYLYTKAELNAAGIIGASTITQLGYNIITKNSTKPFSGFTIKMGCTALTALPATFQTGLTTVYYNANYSTAAGMNIFNLIGSGYNWDGNSNIILNICYDNGDYNYSNSDVIQYQITGFNSSIYDVADSGSETGCSMTAPAILSSRPNIRFATCTFSSVPTYAWTSSPSPRIVGATNLSSITTTVLAAPVAYTVVATTSMCTLTDVVVATVGIPNNLTWVGTSSTDWFTGSNWDLGCVPACNSTVIVMGTAPNMPSIATASTANCYNITINPGASLTINGTGTLTVCGNYINNGTLSAAATSNMLFNNGSNIQYIGGANTGANKFGNLTVTKTGNTVTLLTDIDIRGTFTTSNSTSVFNTNGKNIKLAGHFINNAGGTTFSNVTGSIEFNGTAVQNYFAGNDNLVLNNVIINQTENGYVNLLNNMVVGTSGSVALTNGKIVTNAKEVRVLNTAVGSINPGSANSYVEGNLRRVLAASGSYNFAVGHATRGHERIRFAFTGTGGIHNLLVRFDPYASLPIASGWTECSANYNLPALDNGFWTADAYDNTFTALGATTLGTYTATLFNTSYTNTAGANGWTVMKSPSTLSTWTLQGTCLATPITAVERSAMHGFSKFATAQSSVPLPITLINFTGKTIGLSNHLEWNTGKEINSDYFILQRSKDGENFEQLFKIKAQGNSTKVVNYIEIDSEPYSLTYYRLIMFDKNGDARYSEIVALTLPKNDYQYDVTLRPNPASNTIFIDVYSPVFVDAHVEIIDVVGKVVKSKKIELTEGNNSIDNDLSDVSIGVYFVRIKSSSSILFNGKFIKQ